MRQHNHSGTNAPRCFYPYTFLCGFYANQFTSRSSHAAQAPYHLPTASNQFCYWHFTQGMDSLPKSRDYYQRLSSQGKRSTGHVMIWVWS